MKKLISILAAIFAILLAAIAVLFFIFKADSNSYMAEIELVSPDGERTIIVRESDYLSNTAADVYIKNDGIFAKDKLIGGTTAEGGCYPFRDGNYLIEWSDDYVTVKYYSGTEEESLDDSSTWKTRKFDL
ncbi:MAG: hypothetical protein IJ499_01930 [Clostridia bacterium]|nr:hypothetical protein [Clostridia bacterium]